MPVESANGGEVGRAQFLALLVDRCRGWSGLRQVPDVNLPGLVARRDATVPQEGD